MYELCFEEKKIVLEPEKCSLFYNDEERPIKGIEIKDILELLGASELVDFHREYYDQRCETCHENKREGSNYYVFLEYHFYLFSMGDAYVMSSISKEYEGKTLPRLIKEGSVDGSYIVSINVCEHCGDYTIDMEYGLF